MEGIRITDHNAFAQFVREGPVAKRKAAAFRREIRSATAEARQRVLFSGMDCLPGQLDLFQTDGDAEPPNAARDTSEDKP